MSIILGGLSFYFVVDTIGKNKKVIAEYIRNRLEDDYAEDQANVKEYTDPFTGNKRKQAKIDSRTCAVACDGNAVSNFQCLFQGLRLYLPLLRTAQTAGLLVVMIWT